MQHKLDFGDQFWDNKILATQNSHYFLYKTPVMHGFNSTKNKKCVVQNCAIYRVCFNNPLILASFASRCHVWQTALRQISKQIRINSERALSIKAAKADNYPVVYEYILRTHSSLSLTDNVVCANINALWVCTHAAIEEKYCWQHSWCARHA